MAAQGSNELLLEVMGRDLCIGCGGCVNLCPYFKSYGGFISQLFPCTVEDGRCYAYCPKIGVDLDALSHTLFNRPYEGDPLGTYRSIHVTKAGTSAPRGRFQSGGTVSALVSFALKRSIIDSAVLTDREGLRPVPRTVTEAEDVVRCASSKYAAAPTIAEVNAALESGRSALGVVATPCQTFSLAQMRTVAVNGHDVAGRIKLVIGLFCTWALDYRKLESFLASRVDPSSIVKLDIPPPPAEIMLVETADGVVEIPLAEVRENIHDSCGHCIDMTGEFADISVGVLEGDPGKNTLIARTSLGEELVEHAAAQGYLELEPYPEDALKHLSWAAEGKKRRALSLLKERDLVGPGADGKHECLVMRPEVVERIVA